MKPKGISLIVGMLSLLLTLHSQVYAAKKPQPESGWTAYKEGDFKKALQEAETVLANKSTDEDAHWLAAEATLAMGDTVVSLDHWNALLKEDPANPQGVRSTIEILLAQSNTTRASEVLQTALAASKKKDLPSYLYSEGLILAATGQDKEAMVRLSQAIEKNPREPLFYRALGKVYARKNIVPLAKDNYISAMVLDSMDASLHFDLAMIYMDSKEYTDALAEFKKARQLEPNYPNVNYQIGKLYFYAGKYEQAVQELEIAIKRSQREHFLLPSIYGQSLRALKRLEEAQEHLEKAYKLKPTDVYTARALAANSYDLKKYPRAIEILKVFLDTPDAEPTDYSKIGESFYYMAGKDAATRAYYDSASVYLKKAYSLMPESNRLAYLIGQTYFSSDQYDSAIVYLNYKIQADSTYLPAFINLGYSYLKKEQYQSAISALRRAQRLDSSRVSVLMMLANTLTFVDSTEAAKQVFRTIISIDSTQGDAYGGLGFLYLREESWGKASSNLQRATSFQSQNSSYWVGLGQACYYNEDYDMAERAFRSAIKCDPRNQDAKNGLETTLKVKSKKKK
jgi:tetratricopeptide (TPR) repeat protein